VLAVDRHQLGTRRRPERLHHGPGGDQALLVRQRQPLAPAEGRDRHRQAGEPDDRVDDDVGDVGEVGELVDDGGERQRRGDLGSPCRVADSDERRPELVRLLDERVDRGADAEGDDLVGAAFGPDDVERLCADRAGRSGDGDAGRYCTQGSRTSVT
jgi:hypothetical protein